MITYVNVCLYTVHETKYVYAQTATLHPAAPIPFAIFQSAHGSLANTLDARQLYMSYPLAIKCGAGMESFQTSAVLMRYFLISAKVRLLERSMLLRRLPDVFGTRQPSMWPH